MNVTPLEKTTGPNAGHGDDLDHIVCCNDDIALCGTDVSQAAWREPADETSCVVCDDLDELPCERCGW